MATLVTRSGKGSPLTHAEVDANFTNLNTDKLELSGGTMTGNLSFGDNDKAIFGAGSDLQIYHDGSNSFIDEAGTGNLRIRASSALNLQTRNTADTAWVNSIIADDGAGVRLFTNGSKKLETTSTGIDVTGTVTADGLTVETGVTTQATAIELNGTSFADTERLSLDFSRGGSQGVRLSLEPDEAQTNGDFVIETGGFGSTSDRLRIEANGDISFYEDTGTTAKFFWDASAESLGIGTTSPAIAAGGGNPELTISGTVSYFNLQGNRTAGAGNTTGQITSFNNSTAISRLATVLDSGTTDGAMLFSTASSGSLAERMRIDSSGNVGIACTPDTALNAFGYTVLEVAGANTTKSGAFLLSNSSGTDFGQIYADNSDGWKFVNGQATKSTIFYGGSGAGEQMRIDSSGNLLVGTTNSTPHNLTSGGGLSVRGSINLFSIARQDNEVMIVNRTGTDGDIALFRKDGTTVGSIGTAAGDLSIGNDDAYLFFDGGANKIVPASTSSGGASNGLLDLGASDRRFKDLYLSGGTKYGSSSDFGQVRKTGGELQIDSYGTGGARHPIKFTQYTTEVGRFDASGNLLIARTDTGVSLNTNGIELNNDGYISVVRTGLSANSGAVGYFNRVTTDGDIVQFRKDGTKVGSIGSHNADSVYIGTGDTGLRFNAGADAIYPYNTGTNASRDDAITLGASTLRFKDLYLSGGVFLGGAGASNKLEDYEEGTWTPSMGGTTTNPTVSYSSRSGKYTKIGRIVHLNFYISISSYSGGSGLSIIQGMPFGAVNEDAVYFYYGGGSSKSIDRGAIQSHSGGRIVLGQDNAGGINFINCSDMVSGGGLIIGNVTYETTA